jgi:hypothetical protein
MGSLRPPIPIISIHPKIDKNRISYRETIVSNKFRAPPTKEQFPPKVKVNINNIHSIEGIV